MSENYKAQVSFKNSNGDMLNVRAESAAELQQLVSQLAATPVGLAYPGVSAAAGTATTTPAPVPAAAPPSPEGAPQPSAPAVQQVVWQTGNKKGGGSIKFRPSTNLPTESFKTAIRTKIAESGDPLSGQYVIYDERIGPDKLEAGGEAYGVATVKTVEGHPQHQAMKKGRGVQQAYFVDFTNNGGIKVTKSNALKDAEAAPVPAVPVAAGQPSEDVPF